ncbi:MAG TPA: hypothetical protein VFV34_14125 [Blastocatellia bacterium]|nr:hypothetical protein [Blastocatellia bacterium]
MKKSGLVALILSIAILPVGIRAQDPTKKKTDSRANAQTSVSPSGVQGTVTGNGTPGRLSKWVGSSGTNNFTLGDSVITEDKSGNVGVGTTLPASKLTVAGVIESLSGGIKFPDGTVQTTAGLSGLQTISHNSTLAGSGTSVSPLGVAVPLILNAAAGDIALECNGGNRDSLPGVAITARGGNSTSTTGADGIVVTGGSSAASAGGRAVSALAGDGVPFGGEGVFARGGRATTGTGGPGMRAFAGSSDSGDGGFGVGATGGAGGFGLSGTGDGGEGLVGVGGSGRGAGRTGGAGITATGGTGSGGATNGLAGLFNGDVQVTGNLSKGGGSFKIDHPLDPENKYLYHSFVESPDMKNIYDGNVVTDENGDAVVVLPDYFEALNSDFRYQLTVIGAFAQAIVSEKIKNNRFRIRTSLPGVELSWQVTGIRQDAFAKKNRIQVEVEKSERERGLYLHPDAFNQPEERGICWSRNPDLLRRIKEQDATLTRESRK